MKRGTLELTNQEVKLAVTLFGADGVPLVNKLSALLSLENEPLKIELSAQEAETIMDTLPVPGDSSISDSLREKVSLFYKGLEEPTISAEK